MRKESSQKRIRVGLLLSGCLLLLSACGSRSAATETNGFSLYYLGPEGSQLETAPYTLQATDTEAMVSELVEQQGKGTEDATLLSLLPENVQIQGHTLEGSTLTLDFSKEYHQLDIGRELLIRGGFVREFLQVAGVERVAFTVEGNPLTDSYGNEIGSMTTDQFVENSAETINAYQSATMTLYFTDSTGESLIAEPRKVYYISSEPLERAVVGELMAGPQLAGHYPTFGSDNKVLSVLTQDDVCYVNFDSESLSTTLSVSEAVQIYSIVNSLADTCGISKVQFSVDGDSTGVFREAMSLSEQYTKNDALIK